MIQIPFLKFMCFCIVKLKLLRGMVADNQIEISCNFSLHCLFCVEHDLMFQIFVMWTIVDKSGLQVEKSIHMF